MSWNHRVFKQFTKYPDSMSDEGDGGEWTFSIRETYYNDKGEITMFSNDPRPAFGDTLYSIKWTLQMMLEACNKEVLDIDNIVLAKNDFEDDS